MRNSLVQSQSSTRYPVIKKHSSWPMIAGLGSEEQYFPKTRLGQKRSLKSSRWEWLTEIRLPARVRSIRLAEESARVLAAKWARGPWMSWGISGGTTSPTRSGADSDGHPLNGA